MKFPPGIAMGFTGARASAAPNSAGRRTNQLFPLRKMCCLLLILLWTPALAAQKFYPDDPLAVDDDRLPIAMPRERSISEVMDFLASTFTLRPKGEVDPAQNVNTLGEVPDSSWFTNRIGKHEMSLEELATGPDQAGPPDLSAPLLITSAKTEGITPGFFIRDARGGRYLIKFDPLRHPRLATSAEVISTKFFHAFGYFVPENYLVNLRRDDLEIGPTAEITTEQGYQRKMHPRDLEKILDQVPWLPDDTVQVLASRLLEGAPLGPFRYHGTRRDDPNDIFPHENRRELRGLRVFAAWLNHDDSRSVNTLDTYVGDDPEGFVRHHLIDFGSTLGSGSVRPQSRRAGHEYMLEWKPMFRAAATFGIWDRPWRSVDYPHEDAIGRFEGDFFSPENWKPEYPNPAFERMLPEDAFWATRIVMKFSDEMIRTVVGTGRIPDASAENHLVESLIKRRDKIVRYYLGLVNPLWDFQVADGRLLFNNLGIKAGLASDCRYRYQWMRFDNQTETSTELAESAGVAEQAVLAIPASGSPYLMVRIWTDSAGRPEWNQPVEVYLRKTDAGYEVVGIEGQSR